MLFSLLSKLVYKNMALKKIYLFLERGRESMRRRGRGRVRERETLKQTLC